MLCVLLTRVVHFTQFCSVSLRGLFLKLQLPGQKPGNSDCGATLEEMAKARHCSVQKLRGTLKSRVPHLRAERNLTKTATVIVPSYEALALCKALLESRGYYVPSPARWAVLSVSFRCRTGTQLRE